MKTKSTFSVQKSEKQIKLKEQGCVFRGQEFLDNHELDINKMCYCGRPNRYGKFMIEFCKK